MNRGLVASNGKERGRETNEESGEHILDALFD